MEQYCRLCTVNRNNLSPVTIHKLYSSESEKSVSLVDIIQNYLTISINCLHTDTMVCSDCIKSIKDWHLFREKCLENERLFKKQQFHFEMVITSESLDDAHDKQYSESVTEQRTDKRNRNKLEGNDRCSTDSPSTNRDADSPVEKLDLLPESDRMLVKDDSRPVKKLNRRLGTRYKCAEKNKTLQARPRKKRVRTKVDSESKDQLKTSLNRKRIKQRVLPKICTVCGVSRTDMIAHMRWHNDERPYKCPHCPKVFVNSSNLRNHINLHTREKSYKCELCDKEFPSSTARSKHRETHSTINAHLCAICGKSFKYRASLARHRQIHFVEPKVKCTMCDMVFLTKTRLAKHMLVHIDSKPFSCAVCSRSFNRKDNLKTHMKTHQKTQMKTDKDETTNQLATLTCSGPSV